MANLGDEAVAVMYGQLMADTLRRLNEIDPHSIIALGDIAAERLRQVDDEGWAPEHDDRHSSGEMAYAAACYAIAPHTHDGAIAADPPMQLVERNGEKKPLYMWPWNFEWWKPGSTHRNRVKAGGLLVAELARHYRSAPGNQEAHEPEEAKPALEQLKALRAAVEELYFAAYWAPDRPVDSDALWTKVRGAAGITPGQTWERLGAPRPSNEPFRQETPEATEQTADEETWRLTEPQQAVVNMWLVALQNLNVELAMNLQQAGLDEERSIDVPLLFMVRMAALSGCLYARKNLKREPNKANWRRATDLDFDWAFEVSARAAEEQRETDNTLKLLREARDWVVACGEVETSEEPARVELLARIDSALEVV